MSSAKLSRNFPFALQPELVLKTADSRFSQFWNAYTLITSTSAPIVTLFSDVQPAKAYLSISSINSETTIFSNSRLFSNARSIIKFGSSVSVARHEIAAAASVKRIYFQYSALVYLIQIGAADCSVRIRR